MDAATLRRIRALPAMPVMQPVLEDPSAPPPGIGAPSPAVAAYFDAAARANRLADPLARCLAFPDIPGNHWPAGLAQQHCRYAHGPHVGLADVREHLERGDASGLDARFAADLALHFRSQGASEAIHRDFEDFDDTAEVDELTRRWIGAAPDSAFALGARGHHLLEKAAAVRGARYASDTPDDAMAGMADLSGTAKAVLARAVVIEPRLMSAYQDQIGLAQLTGDEPLAASAFAAANRFDPWCRFTTGWRLASLSPMWGGSFAQMDALAATLAPHVVRRPMLAQAVVWPDVVRAQMEPDHLGLEVLATLPLRSTNVRANLMLAHQLQGTSGIDLWQIPVVLMQVERFEPLEPGDTRLLASVLARERADLAGYYWGKSAQ